MKLDFVGSGAGVSLAAPQNPQVYAYDYFNHEESRAQFLRRDGEVYSWGYEFPERVHLESSDGVGFVEGSFGFVDANGVPNLVQYRSNPVDGFTADIQEAPSVEAFPVSRADVAVRSEDPAPVASPYSALLRKVPVVGNLAGPAPVLAVVAPTPPALTPLLKAAVEAGKISQFEVLEDGSSTFAVSPEAVADAGSVSNLAVQLGASLPAAVHDVRSPYQSFQEPQPALDYQNNMFVLRVPPAEPGVASTVVEI